MPQPQKRIPKSFFTRSDVLQVSRELLGQHLITEIDGERTVGRIVETKPTIRMAIKPAMLTAGGVRSAQKSCLWKAGMPIFIYVMVYTTCSISLPAKRM